MTTPFAAALAGANASIEELCALVSAQDTELAALRAENVRLRRLASLGSEVEWEIEQYGHPTLMGIAARVRAGDGFTQGDDSDPSESLPSEQPSRNLA